MSNREERNNDDDDDDDESQPQWNLSVEPASHQDVVGGESDSETILKINNDGLRSNGQDNLKCYDQLPACFGWDWMDYSNSIDALHAAMHSYPVEIYVDDILPLWAIDSRYYRWRSFYFGEQNN